MRTVVLLIKTSVNKIKKTARLASEEKRLFVISANDYVRYKLRQNNIPSVLLKEAAVFKSCRDLHRDMAKKYKKLCIPCAGTLDYADIFENHLCWETQKAYYFLSVFNRLEKRLNLHKVYFEPFAEKTAPKHAKTVNRLFKDYCAQKRISLEIF